MEIVIRPVHSQAIWWPVEGGKEVGLVGLGSRELDLALSGDTHNIELHSTL